MNFTFDGAIYKSLSLYASIQDKPGGPPSSKTICRDWLRTLMWLPHNAASPLQLPHLYSPTGDDPKSTPQQTSYIQICISM